MTARSVVVDRLTELRLIKTENSNLLVKSLRLWNLTEIKQTKGNIVMCYGHLEGGVRDIFQYLSQTLRPKTQNRRMSDLKPTLRIIYAAALLQEYTPAVYHHDHENAKKFYRDSFPNLTREEKIFQKIGQFILGNTLLLDLPEICWPELNDNVDYMVLRRCVSMYGIDVDRLSVNADVVDKLMKTRNSIAHGGSYPNASNPELLDVSQLNPAADNVENILTSLAHEVDLLVLRVS